VCLEQSGYQLSARIYHQPTHSLCSRSTLFFPSIIPTTDLLISVNTEIKRSVVGIMDGKNKVERLHREWVDDRFVQRADSHSAQDTLKWRQTVEEPKVNDKVGKLL